MIHIQYTVMILVLVRQSNFQSTESRNEVCYYLAGCYSQDEPWVSVLRPFPPPRSPEEINVKFFLLTKNTATSNITDRYLVELNPGYTPKSFSLINLDYYSGRPVTVFIVHGFASSAQSSWMADMALAYLSRLDANVFLVDWGDGARNANYLQVAANIRVVGFIVSKFLSWLIDRTQLNPFQVHLIGHSLGAHCLAYVGKNIPGIYRLTGLDPAQIGFEGSPPEVRLNQTDALFIDVIHTNAKPTVPTFGLGYIVPLGDVDFYFNGGAHQPGCAVDTLNPEEYPSPLDIAVLPVEVIFELISCSHVRATEYFIEAIGRTDCIMWGRKENAPARFLNFITFGTVETIIGNTLGACNLDRCTPVGLETFLFPARGKFLVSTAFTSPYCIPEDRVTQRMLNFFDQYQQQRN